MEGLNGGLIETILDLPIFKAEWVLWLLIVLSVASVMVMIERAVFYARHRLDIDAVRTRLNTLLRRGDFAAAANYLKGFDSLETNVTLAGLLESERGPDAVEDTLQGALSRERQRYDKRLTFLATIGNNAPFIGLFGTVLGIIHAFQDLSVNMADASNSVMAGIAEALVATAIGLVVAIPAVIAFNAFKTRVNTRVANTDLLARTLLSHLKGEPQVDGVLTSEPPADDTRDAQPVGTLTAATAEG